MTIVVEFVGLPGAGKTTLSRTVAEELESSGLAVTEPTRKTASRAHLYRLASKSRFAITCLSRYPRAGLSTCRAVLATDQRSGLDLVQVLYNYLYVSGVVDHHRSSTPVCLLDQGQYQAIWSLGLRSGRPWSELFDRFGGELLGPSPDLVVLVEADESTIATRLQTREHGDTRFRHGSEEIKRSIDGYEALKSTVRSAEGGIRSIVVSNETRDNLRPNARRVADVIRSMVNDDG